MAEFCETCPDRGNCDGQIQGFQVLASETQGKRSLNGQSASFRIEQGNPIGPTEMTVVYRDDMGRGSSKVVVDGNSYVDAENRAKRHVEQIANCSAPTETKRFLGLFTVKHCAANGPS